jgi:hypothetical protein
MAILFVREQFLGREGSGDSKAQREYKRWWKVGVDSLLYDAYTILTAPGLPLLFSVYVGSDGVVDPLGARLHKYTSEHADDFVWHVTAHYSNQPRANTGRGRDGTEQAGDKNPLNRPTEISSDGVTFEKPIDFTPDGVAIVNSVGERFDPPVTRDDVRRTFLFVRVEAQPNPLADTYKDVVNSDTWLGRPPGTAKLGMIKEQRADENGQLFWKVSYPISVDLDGWDARTMDVGTKWLDAAGTSHQVFRDAYDHDISGQQPLNGEGRPLYPQGSAGSIAPGAASKLSLTIGAGDTTLTVTSATGFPQLAATYPITLKIGSELLQATALSGSTFTVTRGYGGSAPAGHLANAVVQMQPYLLVFKRYSRLPFAALNLP